WPARRVFAPTLSLRPFPAPILHRTASPPNPTAAGCRKRKKRSCVRKERDEVLAKGLGLCYRSARKNGGKEESHICVCAAVQGKV
ncbi:unnamed protein product, partial [Urochloa humidicola]